MVPPEELSGSGRDARWHKRLLTVVPALVLIALLAYGFLTEAGRRGPEAIPDFELPVVGGGTLSRDDLEGDLVVMNFWASWCGPCRLEAPALEAAHERYSDRVRFVGVVVQDSELGAQEFIEEFGVSYPNVLDENETLSGELFEFFGLPRTYFVRRDGSLLAEAAGNRVGSRGGTEILGPITSEELDEKIRALLSDDSSQ